ncbi:MULTISPECIES: DUF6485 family protein [unclassified Clostridioides]
MPNKSKNYEKECRPCILDNLKEKKMPACFLV